LRFEPIRVTIEKSNKREVTGGKLVKLPASPNEITRDEMHITS